MHDHRYGVPPRRFLRRDPNAQKVKSRSYCKVVRTLGWADFLLSNVFQVKAMPCGILEGLGPSGAAK